MVQQSGRSLARDIRKRKDKLRLGRRQAIAIKLVHQLYLRKLAQTVYELQMEAHRNRRGRRFSTRIPRITAFMLDEAGRKISQATKRRSHSD